MIKVHYINDKGIGRLWIKENRSTKVVTGKVRFSYANVWEPRSINDDEEKYSVSLIIPKSDRDTLSKINAAVKAAMRLAIRAARV